jgi:Flp pilus assembly protein TadG
MRILEWLSKIADIDPLPAQRYPGMLSARYWNGGTASGARVQAISDTGAYLVTSERWYPGTLLNITLHFDPGGNDVKSPDSITVTCRVVRHEQDGMEIAFMLFGSKDRKAVQRFIKRVPCGESPLSVRGEAGQSLIEFALMVPLLFVLIFTAINFGGFFYSWIAVSNAARVGVQDAVMGAAYASYPHAATLANVKTLIQNETASLPGASASNPAVTVCQNLNGTAKLYPSTTTACPAGVAPPQDPETITGVAGASTYTTVAIDVTYTYTPFIGTSYRSGLWGIVSPPATVHRRTVMRLLN